MKIKNILFVFLLVVVFALVLSSAPAFAQIEGAADNPIFTNPLTFGTVEGVLGSLLSTLQGIIVIISIIFIVIGAILYITSTGKEKQMEMAKSAITASIIGLSIGVAAPAFLKQIGSILGWTVEVDPDIGSPLTITQIATNVLDFLLSIVGILSLIMLIIGGMMYLTAAGDDDRIKKGKDIFKWAIIGIVISLASLVVVGQIAEFFQ